MYVFRCCATTDNPRLPIYPALPVLSRHRNTDLIFGIHSNKSTPMSQKNIVIVGGGYAGVGVINNLQGKVPGYRIVLVEKQNFMFIRLAAARASSSEDISDQVLVPYDRLFKSPDVGLVVKASVTKIKPHSVVLSEPHKLFGLEIDFDYLVSLFRRTSLMIGHRNRKYLARSY